MGFIDRLSRSDEHRRARQVAIGALAVVALVVLFKVYPLPYGQAVRGVVLGMLTALLSLGLALVYRANRVLNFAQADLGSIPTALAVALVVFSSWPYFFGFGVGLVLAERHRVLPEQNDERDNSQRADSDLSDAVSYTHLTLPTILRV